MKFGNWHWGRWPRWLRASSSAGSVNIGGWHSDAGIFELRIRRTLRRTLRQRLRAGNWAITELASSKFMPAPSSWQMALGLLAKMAESIFEPYASIFDLGQFRTACRHLGTSRRHSQAVSFEFMSAPECWQMAPGLLAKMAQSIKQCQEKEDWQPALRTAGRE